MSSGIAAYPGQRLTMNTGFRAASWLIGLVIAYLLIHVNGVQWWAIGWLVIVLGVVLLFWVAAFIHEMGHTLGALATGMTVTSVTVVPAQVVLNGEKPRVRLTLGCGRPIASI